MSTTTDVIRGSLKLDSFQEGRTYKTTDDFIRAIKDLFSVELPVQITNVTVSSIEPGDDFKDGVWIRKNTANVFQGVYVFQDGTWERVVPPVFDSEVILMYGDSRNLPSGYSLADTANTDLPTGVAAQLMIDWVSDGSYYTLFHIVKDT